MVHGCWWLVTSWTTVIRNWEHFGRFSFSDVILVLKKVRLFPKTAVHCSSIAKVSQSWGNNEFIMDGELVPICCSGEYLWQCSWWWRNSQCGSLMYFYKQQWNNWYTHSTCLYDAFTFGLDTQHQWETFISSTLSFSLCIHASILTADLLPDCRCIYTLYLMSDSYLGLDQQYEIHLNVTAASIAAQVNTEVSDSVTDLSPRWGSRTEKHSSSAAVFSDHQMSDCVKRGLWDMLILLAATDLS